MRNLLLFLLKKGTPLQSVELSFLLSRIAINSASTENANDTTTRFVMPEQLDICMFSCCNLQELYSNYNTSVFFLHGTWHPILFNWCRRFIQFIPLINSEFSHLFSDLSGLWLGAWISAVLRSFGWLPLIFWLKVVLLLMDSQASYP